MRNIGHLNNPSEVSKFGDFLYSSGVEYQIEEEEDGTHSIWILDDEQLAKATSMLELFRSNPAADEIRNASKGAQRLRAEERKRGHSEVITEERLKYEAQAAMYPLVTFLCIGLSIAVTLLSDFGNKPEITGYFYFLPSLIFSGQIWRAFSPIFLHLSVMHLLFNMLWLRDLGGLLERRYGWIFLAQFIVFTGIFSCAVQYLWHGPGFGGMSGVVYALFGFIWMKAKYDPRSGFIINNQTVYIMMGWLVLCCTGFLGNVANAAHVAGLAGGVGWAFISGYFRKN